MKTYETPSAMSYRSEEVWFPLSEDILGWDQDFHTLMLNDHIRMQAYEQAIKEAVKPGMVVLDLGTGTGILSLWALEAGAARVHGIDIRKERLVDAQERVRKAGFGEKFLTYQGLSSQVELPEKVDLIISEILGNLADNEDMAPILNDARNRFLKPDGQMLPARTETYQVPVSSTKANAQIVAKNCRSINPRYSLDELLAARGAENQFNLYYDVIVPESSYLSKPACVYTAEFQGNDREEYEVAQKFVVNAVGTFTGFKGYFVAQLSDNIVLDISGDDIPGRATSDCWKHAYLPIEHSVEVQPGDEIQLRYRRFYPAETSKVFRQAYSWEGSVRRNGIVIYSFEQSTSK